MKEPSAKEEKGIVLSSMDHWNQVFIPTKKKKKKKIWLQQTCVKKARFWAVKVDSVCEITIKAFIFLFFVVESSHYNNLEADIHYR